MRTNTRKVLKDRHEQLKADLETINNRIDYEQTMFDGAIAGFKAQRDQIKAEIDMIKAEFDADPEPVKKAAAKE